MTGSKRARTSIGDEEEPKIHPNRKRRLVYTEAHAELAKIYDDLADDIHSVRIQAAGNLLKLLSPKSQDQLQQIETAETRLIKGLCSGRKAARLGFSVALSEVLRLGFSIDNDVFAIEKMTQRALNLTQPEGKVSGQERREYLLGRRFAFQAILQSDVPSSKNVTVAQWRMFLEAVIALAGQKQWLRGECGAMLYEYLEGPSGKKLPDARKTVILDVLKDGDLLKTPEGVAIWLLLGSQTESTALPKGVWHNNNPLSVEERVRLKKILHGSADDDSRPNKGDNGARQTQLSFAWKIIMAHLYTAEKKGFQHFWTDAVDNGLFSASSSSERKYLGMQVVILALSTAPVDKLKYVISANVIRCITNQRADAGRYLSESAKLVLNSLTTRAKSEAAAAPELVRALLSMGGINFDQTTKSRTVETILQIADNATLKAIMQLLRKKFVQPTSKDVKEIELQRRFVLDMFLVIIRSHNDPKQLFKSIEGGIPGSGDLTLWLDMLLGSLVEYGYCDFDEEVPPPAMTPATQALARTRLMSCMGVLLQQPINLAADAASTVVSLLRISEARLHATKDKETKRVLKQIDKTVPLATVSAQEGNSASSSAVNAYRLLFALSTLQVYNEEPDAIDVLRDLTTSFEARQTGGDATAMIVEILLSFISKPSALFRKMAEQVFSTFAPELNAESMQSLIDILGQKESLSGQQDLFNNHDDAEMENGEEEDEEDDDDDDVEDVEDVEDASDVELVNGEVLQKSIEQSDDDESDDDDSSEESEASDSDTEAGADENEPTDATLDEQAIFDKKLMDALGTAGVEDSDDDGSDMDDEQMMALEPHLATIFREREKDSNKKQEKKEAKDHMVNFKNRVLDLLAIYVKAQPANPITLDLIHPLTTLIRTTTSKPTAEKAFAVLKQHFDTCSKTKVLPAVDGDAAPYLAILTAVHAELKRGGSKLHASACSRAGLFLCKILVAADVAHYERLAQAYAALQSEWYVDPTSKIHGSVFTEWTSWSLTTRKQK